MFDMRGGEEALPFDPGALDGDGRVVFIGRIRSPWTLRQDCPKNMARARECGKPAWLEVDAAYRGGLRGLERASHLFLLTWLHHAPRNLIVQKPRHADDAKGVFALRTPARPNPIGLHLVGITGIDISTGLIALEAIDVLDGTPVIDIKPYFATVDTIPVAATEPVG